MTAIFFAFLSLFGWGVGDVFGTLTSRKLGSIPSYFLWMILALVISSFYIPFAGGIADYRMFFFAFLLKAFQTIGNLSYFRGLEVGNSSIVGAIAGSFSMLTVVLSVVIFHEALIPLQIIGISLALVGVFLISLRFNELKGSYGISILADRSVRYGLFTFIIWGIVFALVRIPTERIGWFWSEYPQYLLVVFMPLFASVRKNITAVIKQREAILSLIIFVILTVGANYSYNIGISHGYTSIVAPIAGAYPALFVLLTRFVFREPLTKQQRWGIVSTLAGIVMISFS